jgi:acyl-coenzyme A thioesterase PaaI-like protein
MSNRPRGTEVVRAGRRVATGEARLVQGNREIVRVEDFEIWDSGGRLVAQSRQFALLAG